MSQRSLVLCSEDLSEWPALAWFAACAPFIEAFVENEKKVKIQNFRSTLIEVKDEQRVSLEIDYRFDHSKNTGKPVFPTTTTP
jgi:hypothetical protein